MLELNNGAGNDTYRYETRCGGHDYSPRLITI